ncbi:MFS transporter [Shewanella surugensis]|uniref:MFS transporter n=1 Tax=Shewanella surugensis TaxID=212020 RepID=A0ABT0L9I5_9GAMM|nr:MFS transporter [Shewanella surugensis]MCL1124346.1 MFS transporter [Shewanella surugensis]
MPFHVARFFRPTLLDVFSLSNTDLGNIYAVYGITAMLAYFPGGAIADYISTRKLLTLSLIATGLGGFYLALIPNKGMLALLYGYWGMTSIFLFWAAMLKATREWGDESTQGRAFGLLDGGRGFVAAVVASLAVFLLSQLIPNGLDQASPEEQTNAFKQVIYFYTTMTLLSAGFVWWLIPDVKATQASSKRPSILNNLNIFKQRSVWLQAAIVVSAYCGYKGIDYYSLYAVDILDLDPLDAASFASLSAYLRPVAAIGAGYLADRYLASQVIAISFGMMAISYLILTVISPQSLNIQFIYLTLSLTFITVFAVRGIYFALLEENKVSAHQTGITIGLISVIGFTPDVFFAPIAGHLLDNYSGIEGYQYLFSLLMCCALIGMLTTLYLRMAIRSEIIIESTNLHTKA